MTDQAVFNEVPFPESASEDSRGRRAGGLLLFACTRAYHVVIAREAVGSSDTALASFELTLRAVKYCRFPRGLRRIPLFSGADSTLLVRHYPTISVERASDAFARLIVQLDFPSFDRVSLARTRTVYSELDLDQARVGALQKLQPHELRQDVLQRFGLAAPLRGTPAIFRRPATA